MQNDELEQNFCVYNCSYFTGKDGSSRKSLSTQDMSSLTVGSDSGGRNGNKQDCGSFATDSVMFSCESAAWTVKLNMQKKGGCFICQILRSRMPKMRSYHQKIIFRFHSWGNLATTKTIIESTELSAEQLLKSKLVTSPAPRSSN